MRRKGIWLSVMAMAAFAGSASAITTDGNWTDWFSFAPIGQLNDFDWKDGNVTLLNANYRTQVDPDNDASGGQPYDIEQLFYYFEDADPNNLTGGTLHVAMVSGFNAAGVGNIQAGDLFLDLGNTGSFNLAVAVGSDIPARYGKAWSNSGAPNWTTTSVNVPAHAGSADPYRVDETQPGAIAYNGVNVAWGAIGTRHNFLEVSIDVDAGLEDVLTNQFGGLGIHWTMECGNDYIDVHDDTPFTPVPEPATAMLFGMGMLGVALRARRPQC